MNRVDKLIDLLKEISTNYPEALDEIEEDLKDILLFYKDKENYIPPEKVEVRPIKCKLLPAVIRSPFILDVE